MLFFFLNVTWIGPITVVMVLFVTCMFFTRGDFTLDLSIEFLEKVTMYTSVTTCKSFSSSRSLIHVLAWQEGKKKKILESNRRTARKNKAIFAHCVIVRLPQIQEHHSCLWPFWCQFGASTRHNSRFLLPGAQANKIALERIYARASEKEGLVKARKKQLGILATWHQSPVGALSDTWYFYCQINHGAPPQGKGWMAICNHAGKFDLKKN